MFSDKCAYVACGFHTLASIGPQKYSQASNNNNNNRD